MSVTSLARREFSLADQSWFGRLSHDLNPMHVDPVAARRLLTGQPVVHGMHTVLWALEQALASGAHLPSPARIDCLFSQPISVGDRVELTLVPGDPGGCTLVAHADGVACTKIDVRPAAPDGDAAADPTAASQAPPLQRLSPRAQPSDTPLDSLRHAGYELLHWAPELAAAFPAVSRHWGNATAGALGGLSYVVGMECPGLHSVFSTCVVTVGGAGADLPLQVRVQAVEPRFQLVSMAVDGPLRGEVRAFERPRPRPQPRTAELLQAVGDAAFAGTRSLVIGGSRGLGELTAKLLAAGGGDVLIGYAAGRDDALAICEDVRSAGRGSCQALALDLSTGVHTDALAAAGHLDAVYYFASPRIFRKGGKVFDNDAFGAFTTFYLERFAALCEALEASAGRHPIRVYLPSTTFIAERPKGMTSYAMAKAAAEVLADDLNRTLRRVQVRHSRLPRLATDQTAGVRGLDPAANVAAMSEVVRLMQT